MTSEHGPVSGTGEIAHPTLALPGRPWSMTQHWNDLLFAHWPIAPETMAALLPPGLDLDTFDGYAWIGVVPFWMNGIRHRFAGVPGRGLPIPLLETFPELNLRTYVRSRLTGRPGVFFFSLDAGNALAVAGARTIFHLPYYFADMSRVTAADGTVRYKSRRLFSPKEIAFQASYRGLGRSTGTAPSQPGSIEHFLTERYCLFTTFRGRVLVGHVRHNPWPLEPAEAEIRVNRVTETIGLVLPSCPPLLHFSRALEVYLWSLRPDGSV